MPDVDDAAMGYARDVTRLLWPPPWSSPELTRVRHRSTAADRDAYVFPSTRRPRLLLPAEVPASAAMLQRLGKGRTPPARMGRATLTRAVHSPVFRYLHWPMLRTTAAEFGSADSIERYLSAHLDEPVRAGVILGTPRANQKPVLQLFGQGGDVVGYAKIGHNEVTAPLVRWEARTLSFLERHPLDVLQPPRLLHHGRWRSLEVLAMSAVSGTSGLLVPDRLRVDAMSAVARISGTAHAALGGSGFWTRLQHQVERLADTVLRDRLLTCMTAMGGRWADTVLEFGSWHGDWGHWNMAGTGTAVAVWDWERYDTGVPIGFDALHHRAQRVRPAEPDAAVQEEQFLHAVPAVLAPFGVRPELVAVTLASYLLEVSTRYAAALDHATGTLLPQRGEWAVGLLERHLARVTARPAEARR